MLPQQSVSERLYCIGSRDSTRLPRVRQVLERIEYRDRHWRLSPKPERLSLSKWSEPASKFDKRYYCSQFSTDSRLSNPNVRTWETWIDSRYPRMPTWLGGVSLRRQNNESAFKMEVIMKMNRWPVSSASCHSIERKICITALRLCDAYRDIYHQYNNLQPNVFFWLRLYVVIAYELMQ